MGPPKNLSTCGVLWLGAQAPSPSSLTVGSPLNKAGRLSSAGPFPRFRSCAPHKPGALWSKGPERSWTYHASRSLRQEPEARKVGNDLNWRGGAWRWSTSKGGTRNHWKLPAAAHAKAILLNCLFIGAATWVGKNFGGWEIPKWEVRELWPFWSNPAVGNTENDTSQPRQGSQGQRGIRLAQGVQGSGDGDKTAGPFPHSGADQTAALCEGLPGPTPPSPGRKPLESCTPPGCVVFCQTVCPEDLPIRLSL